MYLFYAYIFVLNMKDDLFTTNILLPYVINFENPEQEYLEKRTFEFESMFDMDDSLSDDSDECMMQKYNTNISPLFYDKKEYDEYMAQNSKTDLEIVWKTRILLEYTPRGNVSMYYDPFKMGFAYYADQKTISYDLLNACAMKYVKLFRCCDFFVDETSMPDIYKNPLIALHHSADNTKPVVNTTHTNANQPSISGPFIKRKKVEQSTKLQKNETEKMKNKFLYLGKLSNITFLNTLPKTTRGLPAFKSSLLDNLEQNADVQNQRFTYKNFKQLTLSHIS